MKKLVILCLALALGATMVGCDKQTYELPYDQFCYSVETATTIELRTEDKNYILDLMNEASWTDDLSKCESDFIFYTQGQKVEYHSECGTFNDTTNKKTATVSDDQRANMNAILGVTAQTNDNKPIQPSDGCNALVSWANWSDDVKIQNLALNSDTFVLSSAKHIPIFKCSSLDELEKFKRTFAETLSLEQAYNEVPSFEKVTENFATDFFESNTLFLVYVEANSGSLRFDLDSFSVDDKTFCANIVQTNNPETVTDDMAGWLIIIPVSNDQLQGVEIYDAIMK